MTAAPNPKRKLTRALSRRQESERAHLKAAQAGRAAALVQANLAAGVAAAAKMPPSSPHATQPRGNPP
jgi:hypothetical protein